MSAAETVWKFTEVNDWEGETWTAFFIGSKELDSKLAKLSMILTSKDYCPYSLEAIDSLPDSFYEGPEECEYGYEDGCGDCTYCCGDEGYYPAEQEMDSPAVAQVEKAIKFWSSEETDGSPDPLYKLGLFDDH